MAKRRRATKTRTVYRTARRASRRRGVRMTAGIAIAAVLGYLGILTQIKQYVPLAAGAGLIFRTPALTTYGVAYMLGDSLKNVLGGAQGFSGFTINGALG